MRGNMADDAEGGGEKAGVTGAGGRLNLSSVKVRGAVELASCLNSNLKRLPLGVVDYLIKRLACFCARGIKLTTKVITAVLLVTGVFSTFSSLTVKGVVSGNGSPGNGYHP